jgi:hypothetical protein
MKISIDTKEDTPEDIRKAIQLLSGLVETKKEHYRSIFEEEKKQDNGMGNPETNIFGGIFEQPKIEDSGKKDDEKQPTYDERIRIIPY